MTAIAVPLLIISLIVAVALAALWVLLARVSARVYCALAERFPVLQPAVEPRVPVKVPKAFVGAGIPEALLAYVASAKGELLSQFTNPAGAIAFYDFCLERMPQEQQVELARKLLAEYRLLTQPTETTSSPASASDVDTLRKVRIQLVKHLADLFARGVREAKNAIRSLLADSKEADLHEFIHLYCQAA